MTTNQDAEDAKTRIATLTATGEDSDGGST